MHHSVKENDNSQLSGEDTATKAPRRWYVPERRLIAIKFVYFFVYSNTASLIPFFVTYYYEWGLSPRELSLIQAAVPFFGFLVRPIVGRIADRTGRHRLVFSLCCLWSAIFHLPHMFIPKLPSEHAQPVENVDDGITTTDSNYNDITLLPSMSYANATFNGTDSGTTSVTPVVIASRWSVIGSLLLLRLVAYAGQAPTSDLADAFCYAATERDARVWGRQRVWSTVGWASATFTVGYTLHLLGGHFWLFAITAVFSTGAAISVCFLEPLPTAVPAPTAETRKRALSISLSVRTVTPPRSPARIHLKRQISSDHQDSDHQPQAARRRSRVSSIVSVKTNMLLTLLKEPHVQAYLAFSILNGALLATEFSFLFIFLKDMHADELLIGLHQVVDSLSEFPLFMFSGYLLKFAGFVPCFILSFATYVVRLLAYSFLNPPLYTVLFIEIVHCFSFTTYVAAGTGYADALAPPGLAATLQGVFQGCFFGLGIGLGNLVGGLVYDEIGPRNLFRGGAVIAGICAIIYTLLYRFWLHGISQDDDKIIEEKNAENLLRPRAPSTPRTPRCRQYSQSSRRGLPPSSVGVDTSFMALPSPRVATAHRHRFDDLQFIDDEEFGVENDEVYEHYHVGLLVGPSYSVMSNLAGVAAPPTLTKPRSDTAL